jgi:hypothetical protein
MIKPFFYDEEELAKKVYSDGFTNREYVQYEAYLVAKHLRWNFGYKDAGVKKELIAFCKDSEQNFNPVLLRNKINKAVRDSKTEWKKFVDPVCITQKELDAIRTVKDFKAQKILLGFLVFAKRDGGYVYYNRWTDIKRMVGVNATTHQIRYYTYLYGELTKGSKNQFVTFIDAEISKPVIKILNDKELYGLGKEYERVIGGELEYCKKCDREFIRQGKNHNYCDDCSEERRKEKVRDNVRRHRDKDKNTV